MNMLLSDNLSSGCPAVMRMEIDKLDNVIVFAPHADDETIGCGGAIALLCGLGKRVHLVLVSDSSGAGGLDDGASQRRREEVIQAATVLGITEEIHFWEIPDGRIDQYNALSDKVIEIANALKGACGFCPALHDSHSDHSAVARAVQYAHVKGCFPEGIWHYEVWSPVCATHVLDISNVWKQKEEALGHHTTALGCADYIRGSKGLAMYRSLLGDGLGREGYYAEAYQYYRSERTREEIEFRDAHSNDHMDIVGLFQRVFEATPPEGWWDWKYGNRERIGTVGVRDGNEIISFYGSLERTMIANRREYSVCQLGDVMVDASMRGWGGKKGIFYHTSFAFLNQHVGDGKTFAIGFGFPTPRALTLGIRLGLYRKADQLLSWRLSCEKDSLPRWLSLSVFDGSTMTDWSWVEKLSTPIEMIAEQSVWMKKTAQYWRWRYGERPGFSYTIVKVKRLFKTIGAVVLKKNDEGMEIMDIVFDSPKGYRNVLNALRTWVGNSEKIVLSGWGSDNAISSLHNVLGGEISDAGYLTLPGDVLGASMSTQVLDRLWLLGGDTDFR